MGSVNASKHFNNSDLVVEGWYWALESANLPLRAVKPVSFLGRELAVYRGDDGRAVAVDAYCPHMGAHLAEGKVEGNSLRCLFHFWKFAADGECVDIPCQSSVAGVKPLRTWPIAEKYGLLWIWAGAGEPGPVPFVPELEGQDVDWIHGSRFVKNCHPNVMMVNAIDAQHFNSVHRMPIPLQLEAEVKTRRWIIFRNTTRARDANRLQAVLARLYQGSLTYVLSYWSGSTGSVTIGPDFLHFHIIFALRPTRDGKSEGRTILVRRRSRGFFGKIGSRFLLRVTQVVGNYFAKGDTQIFRSIRFSLDTPVRADEAIIRFIQHVEAQPTVAWGLESKRERPRELGNLEQVH